ncbi:RNA-binding protein [Kitasatospora azatica]|uniref:RNA-binding protein n=1 Tax=Kitasatospora azatica TaxID=58347 RepID=UPI001E34AA2C|nr:RNA-binding protein [Kitasatospora azatica]
MEYVYRVTKYDPADRDERGRYVGAEDSESDYGPVEAAYLRAVEEFARESGVTRLAVREPHAPSPYHDGEEIPLAVAVEVVRGMLRGDGFYCRLEVAGRFEVQVGWDLYLYLGSAVPCHGAVERTRALGLFPEPLSVSPYEPEEPGEQRPADETFWARLRHLLLDRTLLLEEGYVHNATRWHRLAPDTLEAVRAGLAPRAMLCVWPDLSTDVAAVLADLPQDGSAELVWEDTQGRISSVDTEEPEPADLVELAAGARAAALLSCCLDDRNPLLTAVLPDADGVLRARWRTDPTPGDQAWVLLRGLAVGEIRSGAELAGIEVEVEGVVTEVGEETRVEIVGVDLVRERASGVLLVGAPARYEQ